MPSDITDKKARVTIAYRDDGRGHGAIWDHQTIASSQYMQSFVAHDGGMNVSAFEDAMAEAAFHFRVKPTVLAVGDYGQGLLVLPGESRKTAVKRPEALAQRKRYEQLLVKDAMLRGRPILAICGGGYHLQQFLGGELVPIAGHDTGVIEGHDDLCLNKQGEVVGNVSAHQLTIKEDSLLASMLSPDDSMILDTNSIHGLVVDASEKDELTTSSTLLGETTSFHQYINARAMSQLIDDDMDLSKPEGFELYYSLHDKKAYAAPVIATQWHVEAYTSGPSRHLINHMVDAGATYDKKLEMLSELKSEYQSVKSQLKQVGFFRWPNKEEAPEPLSTPTVIHA